MSNSVKKIQQRALSAVIGAFVSDAASMPLHWIYNDNDLQALLKPDKDPLFFSPPSCPFYQYAPGSLSPYGDEIYPLIEYMASHESFSPQEFTTASLDAMGKYTGRLNGCMKDFLAAKKSNPNAQYPDLAGPNHDAHGLIKIPVLVARYGGLNQTDILLRKVVEATKVHQNATQAINASIAGALILEHILLGETAFNAVSKVVVDERVDADTREKIKEALTLSSVHQDVGKAVNQFGKSCPLLGSLQNAVFVILTGSSLRDGLAKNTLAGGDNCSRAIFAGACLAAANTNENQTVQDIFPQEWSSKMTKFKEIEQFAVKIIGNRK